MVERLIKWKKKQKQKKKRCVSPKCTWDLQSGLHYSFCRCFENHKTPFETNYTDCPIRDIVIVFNRKSKNAYELYFVTSLWR